MGVEQFTAADALVRAAEFLEIYYSTSTFPPPTVDSANAALAALKPIGQTPDRYSAAGARRAADLLRLWADEGLPDDRQLD